MPVGFNLSPQTLTSSSRYTVIVELDTAVLNGTFLSLTTMGKLVFSSLIKSGVVPQHPPITAIPSFITFERASIKDSGVSSNTVLPSRSVGSPALGWISTGRCDFSRSVLITGSSSLGPKEQLTPIASTLSPSITFMYVSGLVPVKVRPLLSNDTETNTGLSQFSLAASTPAFNSYKSPNVSNITRSISSFTHTICSLKSS